MTDVQVFEGNGPHLLVPVNEAGEKHGVWKLTTVKRFQGPKTDAGWTFIDKKMTAEITFEKGVQVGPVKVYTEGNPEPRLYKFIYGYRSEQPDGIFFFGPPWKQT